MAPEPSASNFPNISRTLCAPSMHVG
jgi:hypothetical protein